MLHKAHAELPFTQSEMIKILQRFLTTLKPTPSHLQQARRCVGVLRPFCLGKMFAGASLNAFPVLLLSFLISLLCQTPILATPPHHLRRHFDFTVPVQLYPERFSSGNYGRDMSFLLTCYRKPSYSLLGTPGSTEQGNCISRPGTAWVHLLFATGNSEETAVLQFARKRHMALLAFEVFVLQRDRGTKQLLMTFHVLADYPLFRSVTECLQNLFQCFTALTVKNFFPIASLNLPFFGLKPLPLVLLQQGLLKRLSPSYLSAPFKYWKVKTRSSGASSRLNSLNFRSLSSQERSSHPLIIFVVLL